MDSSEPLFSKDKFLGLPQERRHKKLALILKHAYIMMLAGEEADKALENYRKTAAYIAEKESPLATLKEVSDAFHFHAKEAKWNLREDSLLPSPRQQDREISSSKLPIFAYLDSLRSAFNTGSIIRTAECFGFSKVFLGGATPSPECSQVKKAAMGTEAWIEWEAHALIKSLPRPLIVLETVANAPSLYDFKFPHTFTLAVGNEEYGASDLLLNEADFFVTIPLRGRKGSLNVANAFAVAAAYAANELNRIDRKG
ncbi:TrmH family RNA methyltransferase [Estrella lausannensis]|uniref:Putative rRNA methylase, SpoU family n=1 Tax=Estrella lausannensis TaxID=483423 RepID=A0A0H5DS71_9BACT|nr:TrmH family RNA methyltransferase [Estrella lausannensis]CRX38569.1 putative rRNA methylase, SpoU family [Estrella lausannensis]